MLISIIFLSPDLLESSKNPFVTIKTKGLSKTLILLLFYHILAFPEIIYHFLKLGSFSPYFLLKKRMFPSKKSIRIGSEELNFNSLIFPPFSFLSFIQGHHRIDE